MYSQNNFGILAWNNMLAWQCKAFSVPSTCVRTTGSDWSMSNEQSESLEWSDNLIVRDFHDGLISADTDVFVDGRSCTECSSSIRRKFTSLFSFFRMGLKSLRDNQQLPLGADKELDCSPKDCYELSICYSSTREEIQWLGRWLSYRCDVGDRFSFE